ncbi:NPC intracellular cholesterol transporter 1-like [Antedon mediterranea]|uniref:NPC intracellular cholesterol transporter 1-like n=1 Tax=Antedon mediterranea TaxID=105859 RepID=UPI003AF9031A
MYGECGINPETGLRSNCDYNGPSQELRDPTGIVLLQELCPQYASARPIKTCCSTDQLQTLLVSLRFIQQAMQRCPACVENFVNMYCEMTCNPNQAVYMNVTRSYDVAGHPTRTVAEMNYFMTRDYADGVFDSCKNVQFPSANIKVIDLMCDGVPADQCTPEIWLGFLGTIDNGYAPFQITYVIGDASEDEINKGIEPLNEYTYACTESVGNSSTACSCQDCPLVCSSGNPTIAPTPEPWEVGEISGFTFTIIMVFVCLSSMFIAFFIVHERSKLKEKNSKIDAEIEYKVPPPEKITPLLTQEDIGTFEKGGKIFDDYLQKMFTSLGVWCAKHPYIVILLSIVFIVACSCGNLQLVITTDPVELWSAPDSESRWEKDYYDDAFMPFYRTAQLIITAPNRTSTIYESWSEGPVEFGPVMDKDILEQILELQLHVTNMQVPFEYKGVKKNISLSDVCFKPVNDKCTVTSALQYYQNDLETLNYEDIGTNGRLADYRDHFLYCMRAPLSTVDTTPLSLPCISDFGGPSLPYVIVGGFNITNGTEEYNTAQAHSITFVVLNKKDNDEIYQMSLAWEKAYLEYIQSYHNDNLTIAYYAERSIEDEIVRSSQSDVITIAVSYIVIFAYIALALGEFSRCDRILIDSKITLGLGGVLMVLMCVFASTGVYGYFGVPTTLIIIEVIPFLILAIGADNMFILVLDFQRSKRGEKETLEEHIGRILGEVGPSMLMCGLSESIAFFLGALTEMPAVRTFALYAGLAVLIDFVLQVTAFVALLTLDCKRQESNRYDICCFVRDKNNEKPKTDLGFVQQFMASHYAPFIVKKWVRPFIILFFLTFTCVCLVFMAKLPVGLEQDIAMPKDSYVLDYFDGLAKYLSVGPPVYFVTTSGYNFTSIDGQNQVCGGFGCAEDSLTQQIYFASIIKEQTTIAYPAASWIDDYLDWITPNIGQSACCRTYTDNLLNPYRDKAGQFCSASVEETFPVCRSCMPLTSRGQRPVDDDFNDYIPFFLNDTPTDICSKGGRAAYGDAVEILNVTGKTEVGATYFMTYHTILKTSEEFTNGLRQARALSKNIENAMREELDLPPDFKVFPYSLFYVYYEQYLDMVEVAVFNLGISLIPIFLVSFLMLGFDVISALIIVLNILMILFDTLGIMYFWNIDFNAISLVNLTMAIGISVEFISHIVRKFRTCTLPTRKQRAQKALATTGSSVLSGVAMTNLPGIVVLAFAKSQLFNIFYFRMFFTITIVGTFHGLVFLPVLLSFIGPPVNNAMLYEEQQTNIKKNHSKAYGSIENISGHDNPAAVDISDESSAKPENKAEENEPSAHDKENSIPDDTTKL